MFANGDADKLRALGHQEIGGGGGEEMQRGNQELRLALVALTGSVVAQENFRVGLGQAGIGLHAGLDEMADLDKSGHGSNVAGRPAAALNTAILGG